jgi:hypothetical protein
MFSEVETMRLVFREVRRVLRADGTLWLNYGDSYATAPNGSGDETPCDGGPTAGCDARCDERERSTVTRSKGNDPPLGRI